jgi:hypothetical protein
MLDQAVYLNTKLDTFTSQLLGTETSQPLGSCDDYPYIIQTKVMTATTNDGGPGTTRSILRFAVFQ